MFVPLGVPMPRVRRLGALDAGLAAVTSHPWATAAAAGLTSAAAECVARFRASGGASEKTICCLGQPLVGCNGDPRNRSRRATYEHLCWDGAL
jgi:hypothetical protein